MLAFHFTAPVNFDEEYQALLVSVAQHCAQALDRARLYESAQRARTEAETANRLKDEFVSIVSHDLRTPLNAMLGWTAMLQKGTLDPSITARALQSIHDNATRQAKLIDDLLDFSRIIAGRLALEREEVDLRQLLRNVIESMIPAAAAKRIEMQFSAAPDAIVARRHPAPRTGLLQPDRQRREVHARRAAAIDVDVRSSTDGRRSARGRHRRRHRPGVPAACVRSLPAGGQHDDPRRMAASVSGCRLRDSSSRRIRAASRSRAPERIAAPPSSCDCLPACGGRTCRWRAVDRLPGDRRSQWAPSPVRLDGIRVLVVDDESDSRDVMAQALEDCGAHVTLAGNARDALEILESSEMDVLLADVAMPDEDGYTLISESARIDSRTDRRDTRRRRDGARARRRAPRGAVGRISSPPGQALRDRAAHPHRPGAGPRESRSFISQSIHESLITNH